MTTDTALEPAEVVRLLDEKAREMDNLGRQLGEIRQALEPVPPPVVPALPATTAT